VTVILGPLSERHVEHIFGIIHGTNGSFRGTNDCSVEQTDHSVEQRLTLAYRDDLS
jgi:hypothetical protein